MPPLPAGGRVSVFAETFDLLETHNVRCPKPTATLTGVKHHELTLPIIGRTHLDLYADYAAQRVYTRLYSMETGEVAWYETTVAA
jgi:hypothetical protein